MPSSPSCLAASLPGCLDRALALARDTFGIETWRPLQAQAIGAHLAGRDSVVVQGTGCGKSLCFQVPAMMGKGCTLVVSPLIALMQDQIHSLQCRGVRAATLNSMVNHRFESAIMDDAAKGGYRLLYVSPERATQPAFITYLLRLHRAGRLDAIVIDEAHCIAQWGHDFRPAYARLGCLRVMFPDVSMHGFTATARPEVRAQIIQSLGLRIAHDHGHPPPLPVGEGPGEGHAPGCLLVGPFDRPELYLAVHCGRRVDRDLVDEVRELQAKHGSGLPHPASGIVYCITRAETQRCAEMLRDAGIRADYYHGDAPDEHRKSVQQRFLCSSPDPAEPCVDVVVATVAFGMGINMPDVRFVVHWGMPSCLEVYHQEIGRAARDGRPADCVMFADPRADGDQWRFLFEAPGPDGVAPTIIPEGKLAALRAAQNFAENGSLCRHDHLDAYFRQSPVIRCSPYCRACDNCLQDSKQSGGRSW
jgi:ATP-dependent DNA helicase RecQ